MFIYLDNGREVVSEDWFVFLLLALFSIYNFTMFSVELTACVSQEVKRKKKFLDEHKV